MTPVFIIVEGETERVFIERVVQPHLADHGVWLRPSVVVTRRNRNRPSYRGGGFWSSWRDHVHRCLKDSRPTIRVTTMMDLYGLPRDFPNRAKHGRVTDKRERCRLLEKAMAEDIKDDRFIPHLQLHEFETLVLASLPALQSRLGEDEQKGLERLRKDIGPLQPEDVNDGNTTAPSKRLARFIPRYDREGKVQFGAAVTEATGLSALRALCPHFSAWIVTLETLGT